MSVIRILPEAVVNKIAAGEVVERPASVVKELLENSLDAGSEHLEVAVEAGGRQLIRATDDGCGMTHDDALLAFERHSTSKIRTAEDLLEISTLGFRGEALPSIAAVSRLVLQTRHASESAGTRIEVVGGRLHERKEVAWPQGTAVEVRDLFFNTPARRKFLKSESTELGHIALLVTHYALAHPHKSFRLTSLTNEILNVSPVSTHRERVYQVMGGQLLEQMVEMGPVERRVLVIPTSESSQEENNKATEATTIRVSGFVSRPEVQRLNRNQIYFFVNRRLVRDRFLLHALTEAYRNILPASVFPVALIFLALPPSEVDVNVHPSKTEVRFRNAAFVHDFVRDSIRQVLIAARPVVAFPLPRGHPPLERAEEEAEVREKLAEEVPLMRRSGAARPAQAVASSSAGGEFQLTTRRPQPQAQKLPLEEAGLSAYASPPGAAPTAKLLPSAVVEAPLSGAQASAGEFPSDLKALGQIQDSFVVATNEEGLWLIDQHAAHERILFERHLRQRQERKVEGQRLLLPIVVELRPEQQVSFQVISQELAANGFEVEPFGHRTVAVKVAPAEIRADDVRKLLLEILDGVGQESRMLSLEGLRSKIAMLVSCHAAIKVNMALDQSKMEWLLRELSRSESPMTCPHGRPTVLKYGLKEIQKAFKRI